MTRGDDEMQRVLAAERQRITPSPTERARLDSAVAALQARARNIQEAAAEEDALEPFEPLLVGSAAKDTWLPSQVDLDLFLLYPPSLPRERLEAEGLKAGKLILPEWQLRYAEHPYVTGPFQGFEADIVPAYRVEDASKIQSAVDRTPFHNAWVQAALDTSPGLTADVRLMKSWLRGIEVYGAETAQRGVSGYLAEVLVIAQGGFLSALEWLARQAPGARLDPSGTSTAAFPDEPFIVIDPVDAKRNAAAAVRADRFERIVKAAGAFLQQPDARFFQPAALVAPTPEAAQRMLGEGGLVLVTFGVPDMREDAIVPHLERAAGSLAAHLERSGFTVEAARGGLTVDARSAYLAIHAASAMLPRVRLHLGPPVGLRQRAQAFRAKYGTHPQAVEGPFELEWEGKRRVAVRLTEAERRLDAHVLAALGRIALGKHADRAARKGGVAVRGWREALDDERLARVVAEILSPLPPWARTGEAEHDYAGHPEARAPQ